MNASSGLAPPARETWAAIFELATATAMRAICARGLDLARERFHTAIPEEAMAALAARGSPEPSAMFLRPDRRKIDVLISDLRLVGSWSARRALLRQHLFPPATYMLERYQVSNRLLLPMLYARRIVSGAWQWCRRPSPKAHLG